MRQTLSPSAALLAERQRRWRAGQRITTEDFFALYPNARLDADLAVELIHQEYRLLAEAGVEPSVEDFMRRFPEFAGALSESFTRAALGADSSARLAAPHLLGRYLLRGALGESDRGMMYRAFDTRRGMPVALKVLRFKVGELAEKVLLMLQRDLPRTAELRHPNVCQIHALRCRGAEPYLVREYVRGYSLADWLKQRTRARDIRRATTIIWKTAKGLAAMHAVGLTHGNIKPSNILVDAAFEPRLSDPDLIPRPRPQAVGPNDYIALGPNRLDPYRAPELVNLRECGPSADVFALGVVAHRMLTGVYPDATSPLFHRPDLDPVLAGILRQSIARRSQDRFPTAREFSAALACCLKRSTFC